MSFTRSLDEAAPPSDVALNKSAFAEVCLRKFFIPILMGFEFSMFVDSFRTSLRTSLTSLLIISYRAVK